MNEESKRISKESRRVSRALLIWLALFISVVLALLFLAPMAIAPREPPYPLAIFIVGIIGASFLLCLWSFARWSSREWRNLRRTLLGLAVFATLIAVFYTEENWRGRRAWENCKRELEARGAVLDWSAYVPAPVPDEKNIFKAPRMQEWFVGRGGNELMQRLSPGNPPGFARLQIANASPVIVAELTIVSTHASPDPGKADAVLRFDEPGARTQAKKLIDDAVGPGATGSQDFTFVARPLNQIKPVHILLLADKAPTTNQVEELFPSDTIAPAALWNFYPNRKRLRVETSGSNAFRVSLNLPEFHSATDYLAWSDQFETDFDLIRQALERPYARMEGNYEEPAAQPIPNFVCIRILAQTLAQRAQCHLLVGQPEKALRDLTLLHNASRLLEARPTGKPMTLVAAMINVAVTGIYVDTVADGFRLQAWREPQLAAIQEQLEQTHLMPLAAEGLRSEQVSSPRSLETTTRTGLKKIFSFGAGTMNFWQKMKDPTSLALTFMPRGWVYQNMTVHARLLQKGIEGMDATNQIVLPHKESQFASELEATFSHFSPYTFIVIAAMATPNFTRVVETVARTQTRVNEAFVVCALERYRLARGQYPDALVALAPRYLEKLPHDLVGGQPLKYRRTNDGQFVLYSIGWNEADDGGTPVSNGSNFPRASFDKRDWVWGQPAN